MHIKRLEINTIILYNLHMKLRALKVSGIDNRSVKYIALFLIIIMIFACVACKDNNTVIDIDSTPSPTPLPVIEVSQPKNYGMLAVGETFTAGLLFSGEVVTTGRVVDAELNTANWYDCIQIAANDSTLAAVTKEGRLLLTGKQLDFFTPALEWSGLVEVALGANHIIALTEQGHVLAYGDNTDGQCDVSEAYGIVNIAAHGNTSLLLKDDNSVINLGKHREIPEAPENIKDIAVNDSVVALLLESGTVLVNNSEYAIDEKAVSIKAYGDTLAAVTEDNTLVCYPQKYEVKSAKVSDIAIGNGNLAVLYKSGKVKVYGNDEDRQCETQNWHLRPAKNFKGYYTGFAIGTPISEAEYILSEALGKDIIIKKDGAEISEGTVFTGAEVYDGEKLLGKIVLYGDINGDGKITNSDMLLLSKHISGAEKLTEDILLCAADTLHYVSGNGEMNEEHILAIADQATGKSHIKQYVFDPYEEKLAEAYARNPDVVGWIQINKTNIDYPMLYGDNYYYNYYTIDKKESELGSIYPIYDRFQKNNVVAGHNGRVKGLMFHMLHYIQDNKQDLHIYKNRIVGVTIYKQYMEWEIFALYETGRHEPPTTLKYNISRMRDWTDEQVQEWINTQLARSEIDLGIDVSPEDTFLTLYTCGDYHISDTTNQARLYIFLRRVG